MGVRLGKDRVPHLGPGSLVGGEWRVKERRSGGSLAWAAILRWNGLVGRQERRRMWLMKVDDERCPMISRGVAEAVTDQSLNREVSYISCYVGLGPFTLSSAP